MLALNGEMLLRKDSKEERGRGAERNTYRATQ